MSLYHTNGYTGKTRILTASLPDMSFYIPGHVIQAAHTIPIWEPFEKARRAHTLWAYTEQAGNNNRLCSALALPPSSTSPCSICSLWLICVTQPVCMQTGLQAALSIICFAALIHTHGASCCNFCFCCYWFGWGQTLRNQLRHSSLGYKGSQWLEFWAAGLSLTLDKGTLSCSEQNTSAIYHLAYSYSRAYQVHISPANRGWEKMSMQGRTASIL